MFLLPSVSDKVAVAYGALKYVECLWFFFPYNKWRSDIKNPEHKCQKKALLNISELL